MWCIYTPAGVCQFCGWSKDRTMALRIYDVANDQHREVTQSDVDALELTANAYGEMRRQIARIHEDLQAKLIDLRQRSHVARTVEQAMDETGGTAQG
jgi:hypothetical protein